MSETASPAESEPVITERRGHVLLITLNRPDAMNAVNLDLANALAAALDTLDVDDELRVGVITGSGRGFSAGMDLKAFVAGGMPIVPGRGFGGITERSARKPLIAAIEGFALAGGLEIALSCDLLVAGEGAKLGIPEVTVGLFAGAGAVFRLPNHLPQAIAMELALTGAPMLAERAAQLGIINRVAPKGEAVTVALELAEQIAKNAPLGVMASKQIIKESVGLTDAEGWALQQPLLDSVFASSDATEGATAFAEKRPPSWTGR